MKYTWLKAYLLEKPGAVSDYKEEWEWNRYLVGNKMFAAICKDAKGERDIITLKLNPMDGDFLRNQYADIIPGHYMSKIHWNSVYLAGKVSENLIKEMIDKSYNLVYCGLTSKVRKEIENIKKIK